MNTKKIDQEKEQEYHFPEYGETVMAVSQEEALKKVKQLQKEKGVK